MILVDTSAWVEFDRGSGSSVDRRLVALIAEDADIAVTEPVIMEVLAGARSEEQADDLRRLLLRFELLAVDPVVDFEAAAQIYRACRRRGVTPRGMIDCLIAAVAHRRSASLLSSDADLRRVGEVMGIEVDRASA